jgi:DNA polymerase-3 subunit gamma/tau
LNCTHGPNADFDPNDPACRAIAEGSHLDVVEIDGASNNGVDQVRDLRETVRYAPAQGKFKIYIIDEVHMLSAAGVQRAVEDARGAAGAREVRVCHHRPAEGAADDRLALPALRPQADPLELIVERLKKIAGRREDQGRTDAALACIARMADGGMRDAQSIFDQMISFCGAEIAEPDVLDVYGLVAAGEDRRTGGGAGGRRSPEDGRDRG